MKEPSTPLRPRATGGLALPLALRCTYCHDGLARDDVVYCASCLAPHHDGCFREHGRCSAPACVETGCVRRVRLRERLGPVWPWALVAVVLGGVGALLLALRPVAPVEVRRALGVTYRADDPCAAEVYVVVEAGGVAMPMRVGGCGGIMIDPSGGETIVRTVQVCRQHDAWGEDGLPVVIAAPGERVTLRSGRREVDVTPRDGDAVWIVTDPAADPATEADGALTISRGVSVPAWPPAPARAP